MLGERLLQCRGDRFLRPVAACEPRRERDRDPRGERRYRPEDLGPSVKGFGDAVPAFMTIPLPRPRPAAAEAAPETEAA